MTAQREIVAGEQFDKSAVSSRILARDVRWIISPVTRLRRLLSSRTELIFSTQSGSIDPSSVINISLPVVSLLADLRACERSPSVHSRLVSSNLPISCSTVTALGTIVKFLIPLNLQTAKISACSSSLIFNFVSRSGSSFAVFKLPCSSSTTSIPSALAF